MTREDIKTIIDIVHETIYGFFDVCDEEETPMTDKDKLLLKINKAICTNIKALEQESKTEQEDDYFRKIVEVAISQLRADRDRLEDELAKREQEPKTGHWIADVDRWGDVVTTINGYRCDKCNAFNSDNDNYCPNCGAKMVAQERKDKTK